MGLSSLGRLPPSKVAAITVLLMTGLYVSYHRLVGSRLEQRDICNVERCACDYNEDDITAIRNDKSAGGSLPKPAQRRPQTPIQKSSITPTKINVQPGSQPVCKEGEVDHGCYCVDGSNAYPAKFKLLSEDVLKERGCKQRSPIAIIPGAMKCGTTALKTYLEIHPSIAFAETELKFANHHSADEFDEYSTVMPYSTPHQIPIEKTPGYILRLTVADNLQKAMPDIKLIFIFREPIDRAVSNYMHMLAINATHPDNPILVAKEHSKAPQYEIKSSFRESVLFQNGSIKTRNRLIDTSLYAKYLKQWFARFPRKQFLILDADQFTKDPVPVLRQVEDFLGIDRYFDERNFFFNETKGFICLREPYEMCMKKNKGRPHEVLDDKLIEKLQRFYRPYNRKLAKILGRELSWTDSY